MSKQIPDNLEEWLKHWCAEKKNYKLRVGIDGSPKVEDFKLEEYDIINYELRRRRYLK